MHLNPAQDYAADIPPACFPPEAMEVPLPLARTAVVTSYSDTAIAPVTHNRNSSEPPTFKAIRIARAKSGATELRLLVQMIGGAASYFVQESRIAPYERESKPLADGKKLTEARARALFEKRVATTYPPEILRNKKLVATHVDLL